MLYSRIQSIIRNRARRQRQEAEVEIVSLAHPDTIFSRPLKTILINDMTQSAPFGLKRESIHLPGISQEELFILREKAAASQIRILELRPETPSEYEFHKISRPSPRLRPSTSADGTRTKDLEGRPLWY
ncbi:hypothetical protein E4U21_004544 [Claviceps maximensis]|nr:hypothetical protein E4U21_004544 [Claviceps maximensis]